ncbi:18283_t:CDS:2, partial [Racocetra fulgida]
MFQIQRYEIEQDPFQDASTVSTERLSKINERIQLKRKRPIKKEVSGKDDSIQKVASTKKKDDFIHKVASTEKKDDSIQKVASTEKKDDFIQKVASTEKKDDSIQKVASTEKKDDFIQKVASTEKKDDSIQKVASTEKLSKNISKNTHDDLSLQQRVKITKNVPVLLAFPTFERPKQTPQEIAVVKSLGIPDWLANPTIVESDSTKTIDDPSIGLSERLIKRCKALGIQECFAVQTAVIPLLIHSRNLSDTHKSPVDICVSAPTGSGKTLAYVLPIIDILSRRIVTRLRVLIILPTRDLVVQVKETFDAFCKGSSLK